MVTTNRNVLSFPAEKALARAPPERWHSRGPNIGLTQPKWHFSVAWLSNPKLLTALNNPCVAVNPAVFSLPSSFFLLPARCRVCYGKVAQWDEG